MSEQLQLRRGTAAQVTSFTGALGEIVVDTDNKRLVLQDGTTTGGIPLAKLSEAGSGGSAANRITVNDANYTLLTTDRIVAYTALSASRAVTLCAANAYPAGAILNVVDESGSCSAAKTITLECAGSDTIDGGVSVVIAAPFGFVALESNGNSEWTLLGQSTGSIGSLSALGIGTGVDPSNPLSVAANTVLFNQSTTGSSPGNIRISLSKAAATDTASLIFQDAFSERAEIGLCGDDNFHFKVSSNGSTFIDALDISATTGFVSAPVGFTGSPDPIYLRGYLAGFTLSNNTSTTFNISDGVANADDNSLLMKTFGFTKTTAVWTVGNNNGALDTGTVAANSWYYVYVIERTDTGVVDALISLSAVSPTMPASYTKKRLIGAIKTDGSGNILSFRQIGRKFLWATPISEMSSAPASSPSTLTLAGAPPGIAIIVQIGAAVISSSSNACEILFGSPFQSDAVQVPNGNISFAIPQGSVRTAGQFYIPTGSGEIVISYDFVPSTVQIATFGWELVPPA